MCIRDRFTSCNKDEVITEEVGGQPIIELDSETGIYTVKVCLLYTSYLIIDEIRHIPVSFSFASIENESLHSILNSFNIICEFS